MKWIHDVGALMLVPFLGVQIRHVTRARLTRQQEQERPEISALPRVAYSANQSERTPRQRTALRSALAERVRDAPD